MKRHKRIQARKRRGFTSCPITGNFCLNPLCVFGCIEN